MNLNHHILDEEGKIVQQVIRYWDTDEQGKEIEKSRYEDLTIRLVLKHALINDNKPCKEELLMRYDLFNRIKEVEEIEFTQKETDTLIDLIILKYGVIYAGQSINLLLKK